MSIPRPTTGSPSSWHEDLSGLLSAMRDVHGAMIELSAREARLFELVERVTRRVLDDHAARLAAERDPETPELLAERLP